MFKDLTLPKLKELFYDTFNEYLNKSYSITFEPGDEGVKCQIQSDGIAVTSTGENWMEAFKNATENLARYEN